MLIILRNAIYVVPIQAFEAHFQLPGRLLEKRIQLGVEVSPPAKDNNFNKHLVNGKPFPKYEFWLHHIQTDIQKVMHKIPPCIHTAGLKK